MVVPDGPWRNQAACLSADPEIFFPVADEPHANARQSRQARTVCAGCPVRVQCLADAALRPHEDWWYGVRGGLTQVQRRRIPLRELTEPGAQAMFEQLAAGKAA
jgi:WhiB family redox-sensing transcriptional regulator